MNSNQKTYQQKTTQIQTVQPIETNLRRNTKTYEPSEPDNPTVRISKSKGQYKPLKQFKPSKPNPIQEAVTIKNVQGFEKNQSKYQASKSDLYRNIKTSPANQTQKTVETVRTIMTITTSRK